MPESRNSGIGWEVDFQGNDLLRQLHDNRRTQLLEKMFSIQMQKNYPKRMIGAV
jgi:hypothetical protein